MVRGIVSKIVARRTHTHIASLTTIIILYRLEDDLIIAPSSMYGVQLHFSFGRSDSAINRRVEERRKPIDAFLSTPRRGTQKFARI